MTIEGLGLFFWRLRAGWIASRSPASRGAGSACEGLLGARITTFHSGPPRHLTRDLTIVFEVLFCVREKRAVLFQEGVNLHTNVESHRAGEEVEA